MLKYFHRDDCDVCIKIDSGLETCEPLYLFTFGCSDQEEAELLTRHLNNELDNWKDKIARNCIDWLEPEEISKLKRRLQRWHGGKHCWITRP